MLQKYDLPLIEEAEQSGDERQTAARAPYSTRFSEEEAYPWIKVLPIALVIGSYNFLFSLFVTYIISAKLNWYQSIIDSHSVYVLNIVDVTLSTTLVLFSVYVSCIFPYIRGTGIPAVMLFLFNGEKSMDELFKFRMVVAKTISLACSVVAHLSIGISAPAVHMGAAMSDAVDRQCNNLARWYKRKYRTFSTATVEEVPEITRHLTTQRNVVMMGATAGFSAVFNGPIGAMMYCIEEIASHWDIRCHMHVGAQTFITAALTSVLATYFTSLVGGSSKSVEYPTIVLTDDEENIGDDVAYHYIDIIGFFWITVLSGITAGVSTVLSTFFRQIRNTSTTYLSSFLLDGLFVSVLGTVTYGLVPLLLNDSCRDLPEDERNMQYFRYNCDSGQYHQLATLCFSPSVLQLLLSRTKDDIGVKALLIFFVCYFVLSNLTRILHIPQGPFGPNLIIGCLIGRIVGEAMHHFDFASSPGLYALLGAGCMLGAWTRTMVAIVAVLLELSGDIGMTSPLIFGVIFSRYIASIIAEYSYTHEAFYELLDEFGSPEDATLLHPNDWRPSMSISFLGRKSFMTDRSRSRRNILASLSMEESRQRFDAFSVASSSQATKRFDSVSSKSHTYNKE